MVALALNARNCFNAGRTCSLSSEHGSTSPPYDVGTSENALNIDGLAEIGYPHAFTAIGGSDGISEIRTALNSTGAAGEVSAQGSPLAANNDLTLTASMLLTFSFGFVMNPGGSQGNLCLGGSIGRFVQQIQSSGAQGVISIDVDLTVLPQPNGSVAAMAGETWNFQCWYRDANPSTTSNFTDAVSIDFM